MKAVDVVLGATDPVTRAGATACLSRYPQVRLRDASGRDRAEVFLLITDDVTAASIDLMRRNRDVGGPAAVVLVATHIHRDRLVAAARLGLMALLPRSRTDFDAIVAAVVAARAGHGRLPDVALGLLLREMSAPSSMPGSARPPTFSPREIRVLALLADGLDTVEVADRLNYSERTVKNIVHVVVHRLGLRNRTHAVAYALRTGALGAPATWSSGERPAVLGDLAEPTPARVPAPRRSALDV
ncbi:helix-turn-helix transcriptional regulator [Micromonospora marina]|uniref:helix-turn-helix transcriptional regulator n=1 Tax=Micromonospora marina TaxID=307120 RepID=UPI00345496AA